MNYADPISHRKMVVLPEYMLSYQGKFKALMIYSDVHTSYKRKENKTIKPPGYKLL